MAKKKRVSDSIGEPNHVKYRSDKPADFVPTDRDMMMYRDFARGETWQVICKRYRIQNNTLYARMKYIGQWIRSECLDDILAVRTQQQELLMWHYRQLLVLFEASCKEVSRDKKGVEKPAARGRPRRLDDPVKILKEMRDTLLHVDGLLGVSTRSKDVGGDEDEERVAGIPRRDVVRKAYEKAKELYEREQKLKLPDPKIVDSHAITSSADADDS